MPLNRLKTVSVTQYDETLALDGTELPNWKHVTGELTSRSAEQIQQQQANIARLLRANGIAYSSLSDAEESSRPWNLDLAPFVVEPKDWSWLKSALDQRARLKEAIFADIYSDQQLLKSGLIPPAMIYAHRGYLRDAVNPNTTQKLPLFSSDLARTKTGNWYVVDDICQYPEGSGYTLENRLAITQTTPKLFGSSRVLRIASYFKNIQRYISELSSSDDRCVLLAPGPTHPHYFEIAYLAKYLGYTLVHTGDLTVRDNRVFLKTVSGLGRVSVIFRFVDDTNIDPLAIGQASARGITGLFQAVRAGGVKVINPLGAGVLENPALNTCLPELCEELLGESLKLNGAPTFWLGDSEHRDHFNSHRQDLLVTDVNNTNLLLDPQRMKGEDLELLLNNIDRTPERYVAFERIDRSVAPSFRGTELVPRKITIRMYVVKHEQSYEALPGGLCLLDSDEIGRRPTFETGIGSKDTWVIADGPIKPISLLNNSVNASDFSVVDGELPSRVAENLFWMGRNAERCEKTLRLLRAVLQTLRTNTHHSAKEFQNPTLEALLRATTQTTGTLPGFIGRGANKRLQSPQKELLSLLTDVNRAGTLPYSLKSLSRSASAVRDRVSTELLHVLNKLEDTRLFLTHKIKASPLQEETGELDLISGHLDDSLMTLSAFTGLAHENFSHGDGWRFMMLGRRLERITHTSSIINTMLSRQHEDIEILEALLKLFDSSMTYRSRYRSQFDGYNVLRLLLLDEDNPRSLAFQFREVEKEIALLPGRRRIQPGDPLARLAFSGLSRIRLADTYALINAKRDARQSLPKFLTVLEGLPDSMAEVLSATYFTHVESSQQLSDIHPTKH